MNTIVRCLSLSAVCACVTSSLATPVFSYASAAPAATHTLYLPLTENGHAASIAPITPTPPTAGATPFFLPYEINGTHNTASPDIQIDQAGGIHVAYHERVPVNDRQPVFYATCTPNASQSCASASDFQTVQLDTPVADDSPTDVTLALDPAGHPRMLWALSREYRYASCDSACTDAASWTITTAIRYNGLADFHSRRFAIDQQGHPSFVYKDDNSRDHAGTWYAFCSVDCGLEANWHEVQVTGTVLERAALSLTSDGHPRFAGRVSDTHQLAYLECNASCDDASQWSGIVFAPINPYYSAFALQVGSDNLPRLAVAPNMVSNSSFEANQLYYLACTTSCGDGDNNDWHGGKINIANQSGDAVALALNQQNQPRIAYADQNAGLTYTWCDSGCDDSGTWQSQVIDSATQLNASTPVNSTIICANPTHGTWSLGYWATIALDRAGQPRLAYDAQHLWTCSSGGKITVATDIAWARFAAITQP